MNKLRYRYSVVILDFILNCGVFFQFFHLFYNTVYCHLVKDHKFRLLPLLLPTTPSKQLTNDKITNLKSASVSKSNYIHTPLFRIFLNRFPTSLPRRPFFLALALT